MSDPTSSERPDPYDTAVLPVVPVIPIAPGPAGIAPPATVLAGGLHDDPTPIASTNVPSSHAETPDAHGDHPHPHGSDSHTHDDRAPAPSALDRLVESVRGIFHRGDKP